MWDLNIFIALLPSVLLERVLVFGIDPNDHQHYIL